MVLLVAENVDGLILENWQTHNAGAFAAAAGAACCLLAAVQKSGSMSAWQCGMLHCRGVAAWN